MGIELAGAQTPKRHSTDGDGNGRKGTTHFEGPHKLCLIYSFVSPKRKVIRRTTTNGVPRGLFLPSTATGKRLDHGAAAAEMATSVCDNRGRKRRRRRQRPRKPLRWISRYSPSLFLFRFLSCGGRGSAGSAVAVRPSVRPICGIGITCVCGSLPRAVRVRGE